MKIVKDGLLTTIQDLGRTGYQKYGVIASGSMDTFAHRMANILVGNKENEAVVEVTLLGPVIEFEENTIISVCGGNLSPAIDQKPIGMWKPILVKKGAKLSFGKPKSGCRAYIAIAGGMDIPIIMESRSTYMRANIGGFKGRALKTDDTINLRKTFSFEAGEQNYSEMDWGIANDIIPNYSSRPEISLIKGPQYDWFNRESQQALFSTPFKVSSQSDRMGFRMEGESLSLKESQELISEAVAFGSIQVPNNGKPIILLADRQTTGGYPKIGQVASIDLPVLCQMKPGEQLTFNPITLEDAQRMWLKQEHSIQLLKRSVSLKMKEELI
ncbi:biotin-dependent carboxyltransferase family protein [Halobacillus sp. Marseille-P3879]|uniref:5-oxoprolinase subunit C family protein n=1 Tax=Halobacillus TaxID=45667 RepID=UPI002795A993|nr:biotin-dependent carboxyltransferase family protein [Halobacillus sp. Marseille-P3879]